MKLRYWYKIDHNKQPIPGSNVRRKSRPGASHQWKEILDPCCSPLDVSCTCGPRYFVQLDGRGKPVDHTIIKRINGDRPEGTDGTKFYEIRWSSPCCTFNLDYDFTTNDSPGFLRIYVDDILVKEVVSDETGQIKIEKDGVVKLILMNTSLTNNFTDLTVSGASSFNEHNESSTVHIFTLTEDSTVTATLTDS